jgi:ribokinase
MKVSAEQPKIIVVGSSSIDLVLNTQYHPEPNETVIAKNLKLFLEEKEPIKQ